MTTRERKAILWFSIGAGILREIKPMRDIVSGVLCHHERVDGRGYPNGLQGEQIPRLARIIAVADTFDAMTSERSYRKALTKEEACAEVERCRGTQFDPEAADAFLEVWRVATKTA